MRDGIFIAFDGIDGSGKTTQAQMLSGRIRAAFPSVRVCETADPAGSSVARCVQRIITTLDVSDFATLMLIAGARAENYRETIQPALARVLSNRSGFRRVPPTAARQINLIWNKSRRADIAIRPYNPRDAR